MNTEVRFLLAIGLMLVVLVGTNLLFPPAEPPEPPPAETPAGVVDEGAGAGAVGAPTGAPSVSVQRDDVLPPGVGEAPGASAIAESIVTVEGPLYRFDFSNLGARLVSAELLNFEALNREGLVDLVPEGAGGYLGHKLLVGSDTVDLTRVAFEATPAGGVTLQEGDGPRTLTFSYRHPTRDFGMEVSYEFHPDEYQVRVRGRVAGVDRPLLLTEMGQGLAFAEADSVGEARAMAYVGNHVQEGITSYPLEKATPGIREGPMLWAAFRSKFFVLALLAGEDESASESEYLGGLIVTEGTLPQRVHVTATQTLGTDGEFAYRLFLGPQEYARLSSLGEDMEEVNPYGWRFFRPIIRPFVSAIIWVLVFLHNTMNLGYGWSSSSSGSSCASRSGR